MLPEQGVSYTIEFVGTKRGTALDGREQTGLPPDAPGRATRVYGDKIGTTFSSIQGTKARYVAKGDEIYVRARVVSTKLHSNPYAEGDREMAWTQPLVMLP